MQCGAEGVYAVFSETGMGGNGILLKIFAILSYKNQTILTCIPRNPTPDPRKSLPCRRSLRSIFRNRDGWSMTQMRSGRHSTRWRDRRWRTSMPRRRILRNFVRSIISENSPHTTTIMPFLYILNGILLKIFAILSYKSQTSVRTFWQFLPLYSQP